MKNFENSLVTGALNQLLGAYWSGYAQHQTHVILVQSWGIDGLAEDMATRIQDEPVTNSKLVTRLLDIGGRPEFPTTAPNVGTDLRTVLENDMAAQRNVCSALNTIAESVATAHDATTRNLLEAILADEEQHLVWILSCGLGPSLARIRVVNAAQ